jgi:hypothetical protein
MLGYKFKFGPRIEGHLEDLEGRLKYNIKMDLQEVG